MSNKSRFAIALAMTTLVVLLARTYERSCGQCREPDGLGSVECQVDLGGATTHNNYQVLYKLRPWLPAIAIASVRRGPAIQRTFCTPQALVLEQEDGRTLTTIEWKEIGDYFLRPIRVNEGRIARNTRKPSVHEALLIVAVATWVWLFVGLIKKAREARSLA